MANGTEGVDRFVKAFVGGSGIRARAAAMGRQDALREALTGSQIDNTRAEASLRGVKLDAMDPTKLAASFTGLGLDTGQAAGAAQLMRGGQNANEIGQVLKTMQAMGFQRAARNAAMNRDLNGANAELFGVANGPQKLSAVEGGVTLNPLATPDQNDFTPTQVGQAMIGADNARAAASYASAARQKAGIAADKASNYETIDTENGLMRHNRLTNEVSPIMDADGAPLTKASKIAPSTLSENVAGAVLGKVNSVDGVATPDPVAYQQFLTWQNAKAKDDRRYANAAFAIQHYAAEAPVGSTMAGITREMVKRNGTTTAVNHPTSVQVPAAGAFDVNDPDGTIASLASQFAGTPPPDNSTGALHASALGGNGASPAKDGGSFDVSSLLRGVQGTPSAQVVDSPSSPVAAPVAADTGAVASPTSEAEYNALPAGTLYRHPDGTIKRKGG